jgi:hypothetical protein
MNYITDNEEYEIYISKYSFPWYFKYNAIIDDDNPGNPDDPMLYFAYPTGSRINIKDLKYNCWGNNFDPDEDLYPAPYFYTSPTWCPGDGSVEQDVAEELYMSGIEQLENEQYVEAKATFQLLVDQFPKTKYAEAAIKELITVERFATGDYASLKYYYQTNDSIQADTILQKLAAHMANDCDIKLENYGNAISFYENIILNPETIEDSVYAVIDLGYLYLLMENTGNKAAYVGKLPECRPQSKPKFFSKRDSLLLLLPEKKKYQVSSQHEKSTLKFAKLQTISPNPFNNQATISFELFEDSKIQIRMHDLVGREHRVISKKLYTKGKHQVTFNSADLRSGIYFCRLIVNGKTSDLKKVMVMK